MSRLPVAARRAVVLAAAATLLASAVCVVAFLLGLAVVHDRVERASQHVTGEVVEADIGDEADIRVRWRDTSGQEHRQRFGVYGDYAKGDAFELRYDPRHPSAPAYPADPDETDYEDGYYVGAVGLPGLLALLLGFVVLRVWWWRRALGRQPTDLLGEVFTGRFNLATSVWLRLRREQGDRWQMVMWDPALDAVDGQVPVRVHGDLEGRRRVVAELPDGTALVPAGRLRHDPPGSYELEPRTSVGRSLEEVLVLPTGTTLPSTGPWWREPLGWAAAGLAVGLVLGTVVFAHSIWVGLGLGAGLAAAAVQVWTLNGGEQ
jgi:hypothetical protein